MKPTNDAGATAPPEVGGDGEVQGLVANRRLVRSTPALRLPSLSPLHVTRGSINVPL